jgi:hypothetical protein
MPRKDSEVQNTGSLQAAEAPGSMLSDRREVVRKLGRYAMYAAPFTVLALTSKAGSCSTTGVCGSGGGGHPTH